MNSEKRIIVLGAAGFIGTNLALRLQKNKNNRITLVDEKIGYFDPSLYDENVQIKECRIGIDTDFEKLLNGNDELFYLVSTTNPSTSNISISSEMVENVVVASKVFDACVHDGIKKIVFISSGGTVYGKDSVCPVKEESPTNPITSYGLQKLTIERLLYLYNYIHGIEYRILRLSNPYGPYQRPNSGLGVVTTFIDHALHDKPIQIYGDGTVVRDYIYIEDAIEAIINVVNDEGNEIFNIGSGVGTSINELVEEIETALNKKIEKQYIDARKVDVPVNYLDVSKYIDKYGTLSKVGMKEGILNTAEFLKNREQIM